MAHACRMLLRLIEVLVGAAFLLLCTSSPIPAVSVANCEGDCGGNDQVTVEELIKGINIALGSLPLGACDAFDHDGDDNVSVDELIFAVARSMNGCPPRVEAAECAFTLPAGQDPENVDCWTLRVPENRRQTSGRTIELAIAVFRSTAADPEPDPFVFLHGGPGAFLLETLTAVPVRVQAKRDLVYFDQRGVGLSQPSLDCPEYVAALADGLSRAQTIEEDAADLLAATRACHDRLVEEGIDLAAYDSAATVLDLQDIMKALGYREWNVSGASYGSRVALTAMRDTPQRIRSVLLDSTIPVQTLFRVDVPRNLQRSLDVLFTNCAADSSCNARYPDLEETFYTLLDQLNEEPVTVTPMGPDGPFTVVVTGARLLLGIHLALYRRDLIPILPQLVSSTAEGNYGLLTLVAGTFGQIGADFDWGAYYSVMCGEQYPFATPEAIAAGSEGARAEVRHFGMTYIVQRDLDVCEFWDAEPPLPIENEPVVSDIPTLILAGEYDPTTPPDYGRLASQTLADSFCFEFRGYAHGVFSPGCAADVVTAFLDDPTKAPEESCVEELPALEFL